MKFAYCLLLLLLLAAAGCQKEAAKPAAPATPVVLVTTPTVEPVTDYEQFPGRLMASEVVDVRSRVSGYLDKVLFEDGEVVKAGQTLFEIDPRSYQREVERNQAAVLQAESRVERLQRQEQRAKELRGRTTAISQQDYDTALFDLKEAEALLASAQASLELARLNLDFTKITTRIGGRMSRRLADPGNLIIADTTSLGTVVAMDPIYAYFDIDERTLLRLQRLVQARKLPYAWDTELPVDLALADEEDFSPRSYRGTLNFTDNQVDAATGSLRARALVQNPDGFLAPGLFVRIRVPVGPEHQAIRIPEKALVSDQGQRYVYVVGEDNRVEYRMVKIGQSIAGQRIITEGLREDERVIVDGIQRLRRVKRDQDNPDAKDTRQEVVPKPWKSDLPSLATDSSRTEKASAKDRPVGSLGSGVGGG